jgi:hypothetical protein
MMARKYNNEGDEIGGDSGGYQEPEHSKRANQSCPHTMVATDKYGVTYCCDCGKALKAANR